MQKERISFVVGRDLETGRFIPLQEVEEQIGSVKPLNERNPKPRRGGTMKKQKK